MARLERCTQIVQFVSTRRPNYILQKYYGHFNPYRVTSVVAPTPKNVQLPGKCKMTLHRILLICFSFILKLEKYVRKMIHLFIQAFFYS